MMRAVQKNNLREIQKSVGRYLAIAAIVCIGVGFFAGLSVTREAMIDTANDYTVDARMYDYKLVSTLGLVEEDIAAFSSLDGVDAAEGSYSADFLWERGGSDYVLSAHSLGDEINGVGLLYGRMPQSPKECLADSNVFGEDDIGTVLRLSQSNNEDTFDSFAYDEYTIVGVVNSPLYMNRMRPSSKLGSGSSLAFVLIPADGFTMEVYTEAYIRLAEGAYMFSEEYSALSESYKEPVTAVLEERADIRFTSLYEEADTELTDAENDLNAAKAELADAKAEMESHRQELDDAETEYRNGLQTLNDAESALQDAKQQLADGEAEYEKNLAAYEASYAETYAALQTTETELDALGTLVRAGMATQEQSMQYSYGMAEYEAGKAAADSSFAEAKAGLDEAVALLAENRRMLEEGEAELSENRSKLEEAAAKIEEGKQQLAEGEQEIADGEAELADGEREIAEAREELAMLTKPSTFVLTRNENAGYANLDNDSAIVDGVAKVFPIFFFAVAALVCSTTMARMVSDQRTEIGTLKALGYSDFRVMWKYILYSGSAALIGSVIGFFGGSWLFPKVIWMGYQMLYCYSETIHFVFDLPLALISLAVALLCSVGATVLSAKNELREMPASLIRPRAPQAGKRILLERISWLWKRLKFLHKVSLRNIFRYKKRLFMMILGIGGCTALILTGFGVGDSVKNVVTYQYDKIMRYDFSVTLSEPVDEDAMESFRQETEDILQKTVFLHTGNVDIHTKNGVKSPSLIATEDPDISEFLDLHLHEQKIAYPEKGYAVLNEKLAEQGGFRIGDSIELFVSETECIPVEISGICENYVDNFVCIDLETYEEALGYVPDIKTIYACAKDEDIHRTAARLMNMDSVLNVQVVEDTKNMVKDMMQSMNYIVLLVIGCAAALAFIVLYNLSNINITERVREIATLKVLGFYPGETSSYVFRENIMLTFIGAVVGLPVGIFLHRFVMSCINIDMVTFDVRILPLSYVYAFVLTMVFAALSDLFMRRKLDQIDMAESLKSIE